MIVQITMPIVLTREMGPNGRYKSLNAQRAVSRKLRQDAFRAAKSHYNDPARDDIVGGVADNFAPVVMDVEVVWPKGRKFWDEDNIVAALKPVRDGIADAFWEGEDMHVRVGAVAQSRGNGGLVFTFRTEKDAV